MKWVLAVLLFAQNAFAATPFSDAITITSATTGKVLSEATVNIAALTNPQKTALLAFVTSLGAAWPGAVANITNISVSRMPLAPTTITATVSGLIVHNDATTAVAQQTSGATTGIIGIVP